MRILCCHTLKSAVNIITDIKATHSSLWIKEVTGAKIQFFQQIVETLTNFYTNLDLLLSFICNRTLIAVKFAFHFIVNFVELKSDRFPHT